MFHKLFPVRGIGKGHIKVVSIVNGLLDAVGGGMLAVFGFDDSNGIVVFGIQQIVYPFAFFAVLQRALHNNLTSGVGEL